MLYVLPSLQLSLHFLPFFQLLLMLQFLLPLSVSMENWTTHSAQSSLGPGLLSVEGLLDREWIMGECVLSSLVSTGVLSLCELVTHFLGSLQMHGNNRGCRKLKKWWNMTTNPKNNEKMVELEISRSGQV